MRDSMRLRVTLIRLVILVWCAAMCADPASADFTVSFDTGVTHETTGLTEYMTFGDDMGGMSVTAFFSDGTSETAIWGAFPEAGFGGAVGTGWSLTELGDTFFLDDPPAGWALSNETGMGVNRILIDGAPGDTVFDTEFSGFGTAGSKLAQNFDPTMFLSDFDVELDVLATYRDEIALTGEAAVGDLFRVLDLEFTSAGGFTSGGGTLTFAADTDSLLIPGDLVAAATVVPVPGSILLCALGLGVVACAKRRSGRIQETSGGQAESEEGLLA